jgi:iron complex transport system ATP-binding protein
VTLRIERLAVRYGARLAVTPTSFTMARGELVALVGPNGAGKTSLLKAIAGLFPRAGGATWDGRDFATLDARERARTVAYLPQSAAVHWPLKARDLVGLGRLPHRAVGQAETSADREAIDAAMRSTEVVEFGERAVDELSAGERSRVLLARALAVRAPALLVDEPIAALDPYHQLQIMAVLQSYARPPAAVPALVVAVLHDVELAARFCSRVLLMHEGSVVADGTAADVLNAEALRRYYRVTAYVGDYEGERLIVPWRRVD